ncbi:MAG: biotin-dependent carboxylase-like uncharacterized protein [Halieaceae bacterium]
MSALHVKQPGLLSLLQDRGRFGEAALGLSNGGPMDPVAHNLCNRLLQNHSDATVVEVSFGGLELEAGADTQLCITGAELTVRIDNRECATWEVLDIRAGQRLTLGFSERGCRSYLGVRGGFIVQPSFGSTATVLREGIGGLRGDRLAVDDILPFAPSAPMDRLRLHRADRPHYSHQATVRVVPGYQEHHFARIEQRRFFSSAYLVSQRSDRMGYRLDGPAVRCDIEGILSEGIAQGAIQVPADGQPIVLLNDRQTIGGYPKLGCALSIDCAVMAQLRAGDELNFTPISKHNAHNALHLAQAFELSRRLELIPHDNR